MLKKIIAVLIDSIVSAFDLSSERARRNLKIWREDFSAETQNRINRQRRMIERANRIEERKRVEAVIEHLLAEMDAESVRREMLHVRCDMYELWPRIICDYEMPAWLRDKVALQSDMMAISKDIHVAAEIMQQPKLFVESEEQRSRVRSVRLPENLYHA